MHVLGELCLAPALLVELAVLVPLLGNEQPPIKRARGIRPSLSTSGETLTIEVSMNLEGENGERRTCWRRARMELRLMVLPSVEETRTP